MSLPLFTENINIIASLEDCPVMDPSELKAKFDEAAVLIRDYINEELIPAIESELGYMRDEIINTQE